jgi:hypothetical protein
LTHRFAEGIYVREIRIPAGTVLTGKLHKHQHPNVLLHGEVLVVTEHGGREHLVAPLVMMSPPGTKRAVLALADTVWITIHANPDNTQDLAVLEDQIIAPDYAALAAPRAGGIDDDRADYLAVLAEVGVSHAAVRALTEHEADQIPMPEGYAVEVRSSPLDGLGVFVTHAFQAGEIIAPARLGLQRTPVGRYTNHAHRPNGCFVVEPARLSLMALQALQAGEEVTVDYRAARQAAAHLDAQMGLHTPHAGKDRHP